jgi:peptide/nickel transport system permease protein
MSYPIQAGVPDSHGQPGETVRDAPSAGLWRLAWRRMQSDRVGMTALVIVLAYFILLIASMSGLVAADWDEEVAYGFAPPTFLVERDAGYGRQPLTAQATSLPAGIDYYGVRDPLAADLQAIDRQSAGEGAGQVVARKSSLPLGADKWGHDVLKKTIKGAETSILVGLISALTAVVLGSVLGAVSGYFGGLVDDFFNWFYNIFTAIPYLLLVLAVAAVLQSKGVVTIILILGLTGWTGTYRLMRAEYIKHKSREYVLAASAIGASHARRLFSHILPNVSHVALVQMSVLTVGFIKSEVILSFLGFGVPVGMVSWGSMLNEAQHELILGKWWQMAAASFAMAVLVTAFSLMADALRDALDPKLK